MTPEPLDVELTGSVAAVRIGGEIDRRRAAELRGPLLDATPPEVVAVLVDLADVTYLDSAAIHLLLDLHRELRRRGHALHLVRPRRRTPSYVLDITDVGTGIPVHPDAQTALAVMEPDAP